MTRQTMDPAVGRVARVRGPALVTAMTVPVRVRPAPWTTAHRVAVRRWRPGDEAAVAEIAAGASLQTRYQRFFGGYPGVPLGYTAALAAAIEAGRGDAVLAMVADTPVGWAEYVAGPAAPDRFDLGVCVTDAWHHRGVGRRLVVALAALTRGRGVDHWHARVLADNRPAQTAIHALWPDVVGHSDQTEVVYRLPTTPA